MYNMEIYCTRRYCIENLYWTRRLVQYGFSIQYRLVQYISILYITMYNNLLLFSPLSHVISMLTVLLFYVSVRHDLTAQFKYEHSVTSWWIQLRAWVLNVPTQVWCTPQWIFHDRKVKYVCRFFSYQLLLY